MPVPLEPGDRKILIGAGVALVVLAALALRFAPAAPDTSFGIPSTYSAQAGGAKAAYLLLEELGYKVKRWDRAPAELPSGADHPMLILAQPLLPASVDDNRSLRQFLREGGTVLFAGGFGVSMLPQADASPYEPSGSEWWTFHPAVPSPLARGAADILMAPNMRWDNRSADQIAVYGEGENAVVITYPYAKGHVIWWAAATPLQNLGISKADNLKFFLNCVGAPGERRILWDEYFHGQRGSLWTYFAGTPIPWGLLQTGLVALALFLTFGRRSGAIRTPQVESRLAPLEFVETLGDLYHRAHAGSAAVGIEYQRFRYLLSRRLGVPPSASITQLHDAVRYRLGWKEPGFFETLQRAEHGVRDPTINDKEALAIAQALEQYEDLWQLKPRKAEEKRAWRNK